MCMPILGQLVLFVNTNPRPVVYYIPVMKMQLRIRDLREDADLTQKQVAEYLLCDQSLYSKYELEKRELPLDYAIKLSQFYGTSVDYLVGLTAQKEPYPR